MDMKVLFVSFVAGLGVGALYGLIRVKSPAPPIVALTDKADGRSTGNIELLGLNPYPQLFTKHHSQEAE